MMRAIFVSIALSFGLTSCDPTYPISILNETGDTVKVEAVATSAFNSIHLPRFDSSGLRRVEFELLPGEELRCGTAIGEIDNDLPFEQVKFIFASDSIVATTRAKVRALFDKGIIWGLAKPYRITLRPIQ